MVGTHSTALGPNGPPECATQRRPRTESIVAVILLLLLGAALVGAAGGRIERPFGDSHDGRNGAVWSNGSRALREDGPVASRLGAVRADGSTYANHPPLLVWTLAGAETAAGDEPATDRGWVLLATLAAIGLLHLAAVELGIRPLASTVGLCVAFATPMALAYGAMVDTPMFSLPFAAAVLLVWARCRGDRPPTLPLTAGVGLLAALSGWEAAALALVVAACLVGEGHRDPARRRAGAVLAAGAVAGTAVAFGWGAWAYGSGGILLQQLGRRSSDAYGASPSAAFWNQLVWVGQLFGPALLGVAMAAAAAVLDRPRRAVFVVVTGLPLAYSALLWNGAAIHDYWNYWLLLPIALGLAWTAHELMALAARRVPPTAILTGAAIAAIVFVTFLLTQRSGSLDKIEQGFLPAELVQAYGDTAQYSTVADIGETTGAGDWLAHLAHRPAAHLQTADDLRRLGGADPGAPVLVSRACAAGPPGSLCRQVWSQLDTNDATGQVWRVVPAGSLADLVGR